MSEVYPDIDLIFTCYAVCIYLSAVINIFTVCMLLLKKNRNHCHLRKKIDCRQITCSFKAEMYTGSIQVNYDFMILPYLLLSTFFTQAVNHIEAYLCNLCKLLSVLGQS